ncbi:hypothetical protein AB0420_31390 [Streptomyces caelestis]|uniref:MmyB family transcriptional regulator n=1 Tax=Streptomyces TaxID=1883 RepID=UPI000B08D698|nr:MULTISPECIES: hypothetical protein [Streptomyces]
MTGSPAFIRNGRLDILAVNDLGRALYAPLFTTAALTPVNIARFQFLDATSRGFFPDWDASVNTTVSLLRTEAGHAPGDTDLTGLIGELVIRSDEFRTAWARHNVRLHHTGRKAFRHPAIGEITLDFDAMELPAHPGLTLSTYSAEPDTPTTTPSCCSRPGHPPLRNEPTPGPDRPTPPLRRADNRQRIDVGPVAQRPHPSRRLTAGIRDQARQHQVRSPLGPASPSPRASRTARY